MLNLFQHLFDSNRFRTKFGMTFLFFSFTIYYSPCTSAQSPVLTYAHYVVDTLTSHSMNGRGYLDSSDWKAATFIRNEFKKDSLLNFKGSYFQSYSINTNEFPGKMSVLIGERALVPGKDFLVQAYSNSVHGTFSLYKIEKDSADTTMNSIVKILKAMMKNAGPKTVFAFQRNQFSKDQYQAFMQEIIAADCFGAAGCVEFTSEKLTWDASQDQRHFCYLQVKEDMPAEKKVIIRLDVESWFRQNYYTQNVIGYLKGTTIPDSFIVFTSHYDHLGQMGDGTYFPGANDNASGTSMVLNLANYFHLHPSKYSVVFICFSGEELGLVGSGYFVEHPQFPLGKIKFLLNLDIVGTGEEGIKVVNATEFSKQFDKLVKLNETHQYLKLVSPRGKAANSDHYPFYLKGVPCFFIYTMGGIPAYHDIYDRAETLPLTKYEDLFKLLIDFESSF